MAGAALVDLDGTLWNSARWYPEVIAAEARCPVANVVDALQAGRPIARVLIDFGVSKSRFPDVCRRAITKLEVFDGVGETLTRFRERGIATAAVTNLPSWIATPMLRSTGLEPLLDVVIDYGKTGRHKPHPEPLLAALAALGVLPNRDSWYVGDLPADADAASAAQVAFAWAGYAATGARVDADAVLHSFAQLEDLFK